MKCSKPVVNWERDGMNVKDYLHFVEWYFDYIGKLRFDNSSPMIQTVRNVRRNERLPVIIIAYMIIMASILLAILRSESFLLSIAMVIVAMGMLTLCRFSFIYYFFLYVRYYNRNTSINDGIITYECILLDPTNEIRKMIARYFRIVDEKGNIFALKFLLSDKRKRNKRKLSKKDIFVLKIKPNAILLDNKELHAGKLHEMSDLEKLLCEVESSMVSKE